MEPFSFVESKDRVCPHGVSLKFDCYQCAFNVVKKSQSGVCSHWIPKNQSCYACKREMSKEDPFTKRPYIPVNKNTNISTSAPSMEFFQQQQKNQINSDKYSNQMFPSFNGYITPDKTEPNFPQPVNSVGGGRYRPATDPRRSMLNGRDDTRRAQNDKDMGFMMNRSVQESGFLNHQQNTNNLWGNPVIKSNFPKVDEKNLEMIPNYGINTRTLRKIDSAGRNENIFLNRSLVQPDMRHGNRFYEIMPQTDRQSGSKRASDNMMANQFQQQSAQIYSQMDYQKAFDSGASISRGSVENFRYKK
jgi:hypothetical protein